MRYIFVKIRFFYTSLQIYQNPFAQNKMYRSFSTGFSPGPNPFVK